MTTFLPSMKPLLPRPLRKAATRCCYASGDLLLRNPTVATGACELAFDGHTTTLPSSRISSRRSMRSPRSPATVDQQRRASDKTGGGRSEKHDGLRYILDGASATQRDAVEDPFAGLWVVEKRLCQRGLHKGRRDRDDA